MTGKMKQKTETLFRDILGSSPTIKVLEFFIEGRGLDYTITDVATATNTGRTVTYKIFERLTKKGVIKKTRQIGTAKLFTLSVDKEISKDLCKIFDNLIGVGVRD